MVQENEFNLKEHLKKEHGSNPISDYLREIIYGGLDGIVTTFAVVAGFAGAGHEIEGVIGTTVVLLFGLANLFADGISMGLGSFLSLRSEKALYRVNREKEQEEIRDNPYMEAQETRKILIDKGYNEQDAEDMVTLYRKNPAFWLEFMMDYELETSKLEQGNGIFKSIATFSSFVFFGFIPLIPYLFKFPQQNYFSVSIVSTAVALALLGLLRWNITQTQLFQSFFDVFIIGTVATVVAYIVGTFFRL